MDSLNQHFVLEPTEVPLNVPGVWLSFHAYLDIITQNYDWDIQTGYQFGLLEFSFFSLNAEKVAKSLFDVLLRLEIQNVNIDAAKSPHMHTGTVKLKAKYSVNGVLIGEDFISYQIKSINENNLNFIWNDPDNFYKTNQTKNFNYFSLLSPQPFLLMVNSKTQ
jgi:hypothetical protein